MSTKPENPWASSCGGMAISSADRIHLVKQFTRKQCYDALVLHGTPRVTLQKTVLAAINRRLKHFAREHERELRETEAEEQYRYQGGEYLADIGDICEFDLETVRVWGPARPGGPVEHWDTEKGTEGEVVKLLPGGKLRIRYEHPNPDRGQRRIQTVTRPTADCVLLQRVA